MPESDNTFEAHAFRALASCFYDAVPLEFRANCVLTSEVAKRALQREGIEAEVLPCQFWYAAPDRDHVIGFTGRGPGNAGWDGHAICVTRDHFIDAALFHLERDLGVQVPPVITGRRFSVASQAIARGNLSTTERIWWHNPPTGVPTRPPEPLPTLVTRLADALHERMQHHLDRVAVATISRW
jgi:hypothetical protein